MRRDCPTSPGSRCGCAYRTAPCGHRTGEEELGNAPNAIPVAASRAAIAGHVGTAARAAGLTVRSLGLPDPYEPAPMVELEIVKYDLGGSLRAFETHMDRRGTAGMSVRIVAPDGHLVYLNVSANQTGTSVTYADPRWMGPVRWGLPDRRRHRPLAGVLTLG